MRVRQVPSRRRAVLGAALVGGLGASLYMSGVRVAGGLPACGPIAGCDSVALSRYSEIAGIPVAFLGVAFSTLLLGLVVASLRRHQARLVWAAYGLATLGIVFVAYLTVLELFVIHAICLWCVAYGLAVLVAWLLLAIEVRGPAHRHGTVLPGRCCM